jgi:hypothetical protein
MGENKKSIDGIIEKLALITDAAQTLFPTGKSAIVFELGYNDFKKMQRNFREVDSQYKKFKIDISGVEVIFILEGEFNIPEPTPEPEPKKKSFWSRLLSNVSRKSSVKN